MRAAFICLAAILATGCLSHREEPVQSRESWLRQKALWLTDQDVSARTPQVSFGSSDETERDDEGCIWYDADGDGLIRFADQTWLLSVTHSSLHYGGDIGEIMLVYTSEGKFYVSSGHPCKYLIVRSKEPIRSLRDFLRSVGAGTGDLEEARWREYRIPDAVTER